jgi:hypothetical protein
MTQSTFIEVRWEVFNCFTTLRDSLNTRLCGENCRSVNCAFCVSNNYDFLHLSDVFTRYDRGISQ